MISKAKRAAINQRFLKIDITTFRIIEIIGEKKDGIPDDILFGATPDTLITDPVMAHLCRTAILAAYDTGIPITIILPLTWNGSTINARVHFKRGGRYTDDKTIIAYADQIDRTNQDE